MSWSLFLSYMGMLTVIVLLIVQLMRQDQKIRALEGERAAFKRRALVGAASSNAPKSEFCGS